ncbi:M48 family metalloprotease [Hymenobacter sp. YC55]|uniref:M48 family metalloprotease n=1 Tax=Hymenobacter sp. YC55 TaxID=3034019 RepID=UPI0023F88F3A|nr:M48 family metalloprotease [Hymenobacter sp. YC55]MDF7810899.1 M48 family metalloprotease [Hymenobacter sp. YC55]
MTTNFTLKQEAYLKAISKGTTIQAAIPLALMYGLVFLPVTASILPITTQDPLSACIIFAIFLFIMAIIFVLHYNFSIWIINKFLKVKWVKINDLPVDCQIFINNSCNTLKLNIPVIGIIETNDPNAFTYGNKNRPIIVLTSGLLEILTPQEANAVIAHELGHVYHRDFIFMMMAAIVPMILGYTTWQCVKFSRSDKISAILLPLAFVLGLFYLCSKLLIAKISRDREYKADQFAGFLIGNPNTLATALLKITSKSSVFKRHGQATLNSLERGEARQVRRRLAQLQSAALLGIASDSIGAETKSSALLAMSWELSNVWAKWYEIRSTHPLSAKRIQHLLGQAKSFGISPSFIISSKKGKFGPFALEFIVKFSSIIAYYIAYSSLLTFDMELQYSFFGLIIFLLLITIILLEIGLSYSNKFTSFSITDLLSNVEASLTRSIPTSLSGVLKFENPGNDWSRIFIQEDENMIEIKIPKLNFGKREQLESLNLCRISIKGWYRRDPNPVFQLSFVNNYNENKKIEFFQSGFLLRKIAVLLLIIACLRAIF